MVVLWVTSTPFSYHNILLGKTNEPSQSGSWLWAAYESCKYIQDIELYIVTVSKVRDYVEQKYDGVHFGILPFDGESKHKRSTAVSNQWAKLRQVLKPSIVQIWGTESSISLAAARAFKGTNILVYMQGVMSMIYKHYNDGMPAKYHMRTIRDFYNKRNYKTQVNIEEEILQLATGIIVENAWCVDHCHAINPALKVFYSFLPIKRTFYESKWDICRINKHTILTNAGGYPIKGHHVLFKALAIVKRTFPDVLLQIPGVPLKDYSSIKRRTGYTQYLIRLIDKYNLQDNIQYIGVLSSEEMANHLSHCNVYVMPSMVENHSASLIEAMLVGAPCISSFVGGISSFVRNNDNAILYNSLDEESLAGNIIRAFQDASMISAMSNNALQLRTARPMNFGEQMVSIYHSFID